MKNNTIHNGRGVQSNPKNRFESIENTYEYIDELTPSPTRCYGRERQVA
ncbi:MAG: hypothetical protein H8E60_00870 [Candidatus Marinimicrobia bacterium]|nr:hypothetical protein [Candidatus Neomarinimicrobiota bacterium]